MRKTEHILIVLPNWVGDVVMATPALEALRRHFAGARFTHMAPPAALDVLSGGEHDGRIEDRSRRRPRFLNFPRQVRTLRREEFSLGVLFPNSFHSALLCRLGGVKVLAGYDRDGRGWMLRHKLSAPRDEAGELAPVPTVEYYNRLARMLGAEATSRRMSLPVRPEDDAAAESLLAEAGVDRRRPVVMLNPGGSFGPSKLWAADRYAELADRLGERRGAQILLNAAPSERAIAAAVARAMATAPAINFAERANSIGLLKGLLRRCDLLITNDTGARHVAAALGVGVVTIFGSTDPTWARIDYPRERIVKVDVPCGPCQKKRCPLPPGEANHQCMKAVTVEMVLTAAEELLAEAGRSGTGAE